MPDDGMKLRGESMRVAENSRGITLMELMVALVIAGIVAAMAVPQFGHTVNKLKFQAAARNIISKMRLARSEAVTTKQPVGINFDNENYVLTIFYDVENLSLHQFESGDSIMAVDTLPEDFRYLYGSFGGDIVYQPNGSASQSGTLWFLAYDSTADYVNLGSIDILASTGRTRLNNSYYY
jgi:prepilin-type N-terminal cleavage/methylation domain-containing protein